MDVFARVVVGVDGTEWGREALRQTLALAPPDAVVQAVTALHTSPAARTGFDAARWVHILTEEAERARDEAAAILDGRTGSSARIERGEPLRVLRAARDGAEATLLTLGGRHSSRFLGIMLGDTSTELLHDGTCSILIARPAADGTWRPRRVIAATDGSAPALVAAAAADDIRVRLGSDLEIVSDAQHPARDLVARSREADLVVLGSRGLHGVRAVGSVSERVAHHAKCSVLVVHGGGSDGRGGRPRAA
jgi:nucleotide-binding universal stress UspA family protein